MPGTRVEVLLCQTTKNVSPISHYPRSSDLFFAPRPSVSRTVFKNEDIDKQENLVQHSSETGSQDWPATALFTSAAALSPIKMKESQRAQQQATLRADRLLTWEIRSLPQASVRSSERRRTNVKGSLTAELSVAIHDTQRYPKYQADRQQHMTEARDSLCPFSYRRFSFHGRQTCDRASTTIWTT